MYKLLPEEHQLKVAQEYAKRRAIVMLLALILVIVVSMVGIFPSYMLSNARRQEVLERTRVMGDLALQEDELALELWLSKFNQRLQVLSPKADTDRPSGLIEGVIGEKIAGIRLTSFNWSKAGDKITLSVAGVARDRQTLIAFERQLNTSGQFSEVTLPVSNLARDKDIDFEVKLSPSKTP